MGSPSATLILRLFDPKALKNIGSIRIRKESGTIDLLRQDGSWWVISDTTRFPAVESRVDRLIEVLTARRRMDPVSRSASAWPDLGLDTQTAWKIELGELSAIPESLPSETGTAIFPHTGKPPLALYIGFTDSTGERLFFRREGEDQAWITDSRLMSALGRDERSWYDPELISAQAASRLDRMVIRLYRTGDAATTLQKLSGQNPLWRWEFLRGAASWQSADPGNPGTSSSGTQNPATEADGRASSIARQIVALRAEELAATNPQQDPASSPWICTIQLFSDDGSTMQMLIGSPDSRGLTSVRVVGKPWIYLVRDTDLGFLRELPSSR